MCNRLTSLPGTALEQPLDYYVYTFQDSTNVPLHVHVFVHFCTSMRAVEDAPASIDANSHLLIVLTYGLLNVRCSGHGLALLSCIAMRGYQLQLQHGKDDQQPQLALEQAAPAIDTT